MPALRVSVAPSPAQQQPFHGVLPADGPVRLDAVDQQQLPRAGGHRRVAVQNSAGDGHPVLLPGNNRRRKKGAHPSNTRTPSNWIPHLGWDATQRGASRTRNLGSSASPSASSPLRANASSAPPYGTFHVVYYRTPSASSPPRGKGSSGCALCRRRCKRVDASAAAGADVAAVGPVLVQMWAGVPRSSRALQQHHRVLDSQRRWLRRCILYGRSPVGNPGPMSVLTLSGKALPTPLL